ncbi:hypothetical protein OROHE_014998 [Orobanche hederae]
MAEPSPLSPGISALQLQDCVKELLKFTLISSIEGKLQTGLSNDYCGSLIEGADLSNPLPTNTAMEDSTSSAHDLSKDAKRKAKSSYPGWKYAFWPNLNNKDIVEFSTGVPTYPLYKHLASSLYQYIHTGACCTSSKELIPLPEDRSLKKDEKRNTLIVEKGSALLSMLKQVNFELHVEEPFFSQINDGLKTIEGRCAVGDYKSVVQDIRKYASFREMLEVESVQIYRNFYSEGKERSNGVLALCVKMPTSQPCVTMASILS